MSPQQRLNYLIWLRGVLKEKYEAMGLGWQDSDADLDRFLDGFYDAAFEQGHNDAQVEF